MKCDRCGYISHEHNLTCPSCNRDLTILRRKMGIFLEPPDADFQQLFTGGSGPAKAATAAAPKEAEAELDLEDVGDDFEFTLDD